MDLSPTYSFFADTDLVRLVVFLLFAWLGFTAYVSLQVIKSNNLARESREKGRKAEEDARKSQAELEEIRLKMLGEMSVQVSALTQRILDSNEHDIAMREQEVKAVNQLVTATETHHGVLLSYLQGTTAFRDTMTDDHTLLKNGFADLKAEVVATNTTVNTLNDGVNSVKEGFKALEGALSDLPKQVQKILSPYCERIENALSKLETPKVEEKPHVHAEEVSLVSSVAHVDGNLPVVIRPSEMGESTGNGNGTSANAGSPPNPAS